GRTARRANHRAERGRRGQHVHPAPAGQPPGDAGGRAGRPGGGGRRRPGRRAWGPPGAASPEAEAGAGAGRPGSTAAPDAGAATVRKPPEPVAAAHDGLCGKKVLIVDDDLRNVFAITSILELYGLTVLHASDGRTGIEVLQNDPGIDIVLMDVMMPEMDGYATTAAIRKIPGLAHLPVIAVTARAMQCDGDKSTAAGATDYVTKPVDTEDLLSVMERWLAAD